MTLRDQIINSPETLSDVRWAAEQRFRDAEALLTAGRFTGAVYVLGLAAEMWLKGACLSLRGLSPATRVSAALAAARHWFEQHLATAGLPAIAHEGYHGLRFWAELAVALRRVGGSPLATDVVGQLRHHVVNRLYWSWKIDLRYAAIALSEREAWRVYNDVVWVRQAWRQLLR
jgi:hypothetical protein